MEEALTKDKKYFCIEVPCAWQLPRIELIKGTDGIHCCPMCTLTYGQQTLDLLEKAGWMNEQA